MTDDDRLSKNQACREIFDPRCTRLALIDVGPHCHRRIPPIGGIYIVYVVSAAGKFRVLNRLLREDKKGIFFIAESRNLSRRLRNFSETIFADDWWSKKHSEGKTYRWLSLDRWYPVHRLKVCAYRCDDHKNAERWALEKYALRYGEVPPLNMSSGGRTARGWPYVALKRMRPI